MPRPHAIHGLLLVQKFADARILATATDRVPAPLETPAWFERRVAQFPPPHNVASVKHAFLSAERWVRELVSHFVETLCGRLDLVIRRFFELVSWSHWRS